MTYFAFYELSQEAKDEAARLRTQIAGNQMMLALYKLEALLQKANFNSNQPRVPAGTSDGGKWTGDGSSGGNQLRPIPVAYGSGDKPPKPPRIPVKPPGSGSVRNAIIKGTVKFLVGAARTGARVDPPVWVAIEAASWAEPYITSYFDKPKTLDELQEGASERETGYDIHHVVEKTIAENAGFPKSLIEAPENRVKIPTLKHWEVNSWFERTNQDYGGLTPRAYLRDPGISWDERVRIGKKALIATGVLKR